MDAKTFFAEAIAVATREIEEVRVEDFDHPTPDTEWSVYDLVTHMMYELAWVQDMVAGRRIEDVDAKYEGDLIGDDLQAVWANFREAARQAIEKADLHDIVHVSYGDITLEEYLLQAGSDQAIHAWDLGQAMSRTVIYDEELLDALFDYAETNVDMLQDSGLFEAPLTVADDADKQTKLLALYGRSDQWAAV